MSYGSILAQGRFTSTGAAQTLTLPSDVDWLRVHNITIAAANQTTAVGVEYFWQRGMPAGAMWEYKKSNAAAAANLSVYATTGGFTLVDSSTQTPGALTALTAISNASPPVVTVSSTAAQATGDIVRIINTVGAQQFGGVPFRIAVLNGTTFNLTYAPTIVAGTTGFYRTIPFDDLYAPKHRWITKITKAASAVLTFSTAHGFVVGQKIRFEVPSAFGMVEMDGLVGTITAKSASTITVNIASTAFTTFAFPLTAVNPYTPALGIPFGQDTAQSLSSSVDILGDNLSNTGLIGIKLANGTNSPAGATSDVIYWSAGKSFSVSNE